MANDRAPRVTLWLLIALLAAALLVAAWRLLRVPPAGLLLIASAFALGLAGYAAQGRPDLPGAPGERQARDPATAAALIAVRADMDQHFGPAKRWLPIADGLSRRGDHSLADAFIRSGLRENPRDADLWVAQGLNLLLAQDGRMTPAAELAFARARALRPLHPGPDYFAGFANLLAGDAASTLARWDALLARPGGRASEWRAKLVRQRAAVAAAMAPPSS